jgi:signal transduction histidine kinase
VFERFFRLKGTPGDGSGLGLAIVKEVVDRHHGVLSVQSAGTSGVKIVAKFPVAPPAADSRAVPPSDLTVGAGVAHDAVPLPR